jgi:hypothetical protein
MAYLDSVYTQSTVLNNALEAINIRLLNFVASAEIISLVLLLTHLNNALEAIKH